MQIRPSVLYFYEFIKFVVNIQQDPHANYLYAFYILAYYVSEIFQTIKLFFLLSYADKIESFDPKKFSYFIVNEVTIGKLLSLINFDLMYHIVIRSSPAVAKTS